MNEKEQDEWNALRYVLCEMNDAEQHAWTEQLAHDQSAREMVAETVELLDCIAVIERERDGDDAANRLPSPRVRSNAQRIPAIWTAVLGAALAVTLLLCTLLLPSAKRGAGDVGSTGPLSVTRQQMAIYWGENHEFSDDPLWPPELLDSTPDDLTAAEADRNRGILDTTPVSWIQEAVAGLGEYSPTDAARRNGDR